MFGRALGKREAGEEESHRGGIRTGKTTFRGVGGSSAYEGGSR